MRFVKPKAEGFKWIMSPGNELTMRSIWKHQQYKQQKEFAKPDWPTFALSLGAWTLCDLHRHVLRSKYDMNCIQMIVGILRYAAAAAAQC